MADGRKSRRKIDLERMHEMLREGKTQTEIARYFGVVVSAVSQAVQRHKRNMMRTAVLDQAADIVESDLDLLSQLRRINRTINAQLARAVEEVEKAKDGDKRIAAQRIIVDLAGEIRKQLETGISIAKFWYDHEEFVNFREEVIAVLNEVSPDLRRKIIERLKQKRLLRGSASVG
jgi:transposase-like protein